MLILARHGTTALNQRGVLQGTADPPMAEVGHEQARRLAQYLARLPIELVLASPSLRARQSAEYCASLLRLEVQTEERFRERDFGRYEGLERVSLLSAREEAGLGSADPTQDWEGESGVESDRDVAGRVMAALTDLKADDYLTTPERHVAVFTHAGVVKAVLHSLGFDARARHRSVKLAEGGIVRLIREHPDTLALHGLLQNNDMVGADGRDDSS